MNIMQQLPTNTRVLSQRNIRRKSTKYLQKQLGEDMTKEELNRLLDSGQVQIKGLISKN
jgi:uncharacterized protein (UPF0128 family)